MKPISLVLLSILMILGVSAWADDSAQSSEIDQLELLGGRVIIGGTMAGAYQYESTSDSEEDDSFGRGALTIQPEITIRPTKSDEIFFKLGFAAGNGLNIDKHRFALAPWAADLEDDVKDINGRNRDYLLTAWYKHSFNIGENVISLTGGIIDSTDYLDENAFANDEFTQFMNEALVNAPVAFLPSYDVGGALEVEMGRFTVKAVFMQVGENDEGKGYQSYGLQAGYSIETPWGEGNYRIILDATSDDFSDPYGRNEESLKGLVISCDQELGEVLGAWIRFGWSDDEASVTYADFYSGGINISGKIWGREQDNIGIGYAYLNGGNQELDKTHLFEGYIRFGLNDIFALTFDLQYIDDEYKEEAGEDVDGWIAGFRLTAEF
ncbi:carbohydrate porin [Thermodesulforhabdus norvegica]|uniref:Porin n=1 Tax=Thermodesulforhabdus norvegica TaxID=39841 RepID=A0A1I4R779_9BACT|nr:carbohydrate porin [Thermodesulforhabdus norvegica]SFM48154.1 porin [Thermodesulforhabdus norvegica]